MSKKINVVRNVLGANDALAAENRASLDEHGAVMINILSAPGSGKTTLLESTIPALAGQGHRAAVVVGDLQTSRDAERLDGTGCRVVQINTEGGCHLTASQVSEAMKALELEGLSFLFIENVGNMVCPAGFDLGEHRRVAMLSAPEGSDKVAKYNTLFLSADLVILNKADLFAVLDFDKTGVYEDLARINSRAPVLEISASAHEGLEKWYEWLLGQREA